VDNFLQTEAKIDAAEASGKNPPNYTYEEARERLIQGTQN